MSLLRRIRAALRPRPTQTLFIYCPGCGVELVSHPSALVDESGSVVTYQCPSGHVSRWDFGPPVPILLPEEPTP